MDWKLILCGFILLGGPVLAQSTTSTTEASTTATTTTTNQPDNVPNKNWVEFSNNDGLYKGKYLVELDVGKITFDLDVTTKGWIGLELSPVAGGDANNHEVIMGGVYRDGRPYFSLKDNLSSNGSWNLETATESGNRTQLKVWRKLDTCGVNGIKIGEEALKLTWSYGPDDLKNNSIQCSDAKRGSLFVNLLNPPVRPQLDDEKEIFPVESHFSSNMNMTWNESCQCTVHRILQTGADNVVGFEVKLNGTSSEYVRQIVLRKCPKAAEETLKAKTTHPGPHNLTELKQGMDCKPFLIWTIGGQKFMFPKNVSYPIKAQPDESVYFIFQVVADLPQNSSINLKIDLDFFYLNNKRSQEAGLMNLGNIYYTKAPSSGKEVSNLENPTCSPLCTGDTGEDKFPKSPLHIFNVDFYSNVSGVEFLLRHFRGVNGSKPSELSWVAGGDSYDSVYQRDRPVNKERDLLFGDNLVLSGTSGMKNLNFSVEAFVWYYPRIVESTSCMASNVSATNNANTTFEEKYRQQICANVSAPSGKVPLFGRLPEDLVKDYEPEMQGFCSSGGKFLFNPYILVTFYVLKAIMFQ